MEKVTSHNLNLNPSLASVEEENLSLDKRPVSEGDEARSVMTERPPVVVVMGHVDHGKTTLLDAIRKTRVAEREAGGITQGIGAYEITRTYAEDNADLRGQNKSNKITFIDTPGHEAFFAMRLHGVKAADVALLVVAADDGVKPQTEEAIKHILDSKIPFIVVINKIDKPGALVDRVKKDLADKGVLIEEWGGKVPLALISAKNGEGIEELLDLILLMAEMEELKYNPSARGEGYVIESHLDSRRGFLATVIISNGVLKRGDMIVCGMASGTIKIMEDDNNKALEEAYPAKPVVVLGLSELPMVGEKFMVVGAEDNVGAIIEEHKQKHLELMSNLKLEPTGQPKIMNIIIKTSAQGCVDALISVLKGIKSDRVGLKLLKCDVGDINQSDIKQAETAAARVFGFGVKAGRDALNYADQKRITVKTFEIIYEFVEGVRQGMAELLDPEIIRNEVGQINILAIFKTDKQRMVVGGKISSGKLKKGLKVDVLRNGISVGAGKIVGLQKQKEAQDEIAMGNEAGVLFEGSVVVEVKDTLMAFEEEKKYPEL